MLSLMTESAVTARLAAFEDSTLNQIVVLTVPSLGGGDLETFATQVFRSWRLGQADRDNGVLLLVARDDRKLRIEVGYSLEGTLTDARSSEIIRDVIVPRLRDGDPDAGVSAGVEAILASLDGTFEPIAFGVQAPPARRTPEWLPPTLFGGLGLLIIVAFLALGMSNVSAEGVRRGVYTIALAGVAGGCFVGTRSVLPLGLLLLIPLLWPWGIALAERVPVVGPRVTAWRRLVSILSLRETRLAGAFRNARRRGESRVVVDGVEYAVPVSSESHGPGGSTSSSSGSGSSGSGSSGGGFSGGGGSSGGGGASGSW